MSLTPTHKYDDIIALPRPRSARCRMSRTDRAAQFAPFAALTGFDGRIAETARLTDSPLALTESRMAELDARLRLLREHLSDQPEITVTVFRPDGRKTGGAFVSVSGVVKKWEAYEGRLIFRDGTAVEIGTITELTGELFRQLEW